MANSTYYYQLYEKYKKEAEDYEKNINELKKIKNSLTGDFYDEQRNINAELDDLKEDLNKSVRKDSRFTALAEDCQEYKEKTVTADKNLKNVVTALENEVASLEVKKKIAEDNRDLNYSQYESQKKAELEETAKMLGI